MVIDQTPVNSEYYSLSGGKERMQGRSVSFLNLNQGKDYMK